MKLEDGAIDRVLTKVEKFYEDMRKDLKGSKKFLSYILYNIQYE